jgi:beta-N-acetylhexosaminidase
METYGYVYKELINNDLDAIMGGHIMMPTYMREIKPDIKDDEMLPATLCPEIMTGLLREKLGFNGMVVTDASHMVAMTDRMTRKDMLPAAINAGCDMFLFFNDPDEDFETMLEAYKSGVITEERIVEALTRILGLKAKMGLNKKTKDGIINIVIGAVIIIFGWTLLWLAMLVFGILLTVSAVVNFLNGKKDLIATLKLVISVIIGVL